MVQPLDKKAEKIAKVTEAILKLPQKPDISAIIPLVKLMGITSPTDLWALFDRIQVQWTLEKTYESDWDNP